VATARWLRDVARSAVARVEPDGPMSPHLPVVANNPWFISGQP
jgi:hypothetical protein